MIYNVFNIHTIILELDKRIDEQGKDIRTLISDVAALKATVETFQ